ncbi:MAG TPA: TerB family tellurite resistance protein [Gammaproteobacteria bacterium]
MLRALAELVERAFERGRPEGDPEARDRALRIATAVLLVEVARADYAEDVAEDEAVFHLVKGFFDLSDEEAELIVREARAAADHAASLQSFTRELHERLTLDEKRRVIEMLWRVALADERLDKHEDHLVRKIAGLLYVPHADLIRIRNRVRGEAPAG